MGAYMKKLLLLVVLAVGVLAGCKGKSLEGTWTMSMNGLSATQTFKPDKSFAIVSTMQGITVTQTGTWSATDKELTLTTTDVKAEGGDPKMRDMINALPKDQMKKPVTVEYDWKTNDQIEVGLPGSPKQVMTRKA